VPTAPSACLQADTCHVVSGGWRVQQQQQQRPVSPLQIAKVGRVLVESWEKKFSYREIKLSKINIPKF